MKPLGEGDTGFRVLRVSKNKREGRNSRKKKKKSHPPFCHPVLGDAPGTQKGSLSQRSGMGLCSAPLPGWSRGRGMGRCRSSSVGAGGIRAGSTGSSPSPASAWRGRRRGPPRNLKGEGREQSALWPRPLHPGSHGRLLGGWGGHTDPPCGIAAGWEARSQSPADHPPPGQRDLGMCCPCVADQAHSPPVSQHLGVPPATSPPQAVPISVSRRPGGGGFLRWSSMCRVISSREAVE